jgi:hypothetical protein
MREMPDERRLGGRRAIVLLEGAYKHDGRFLAIREGGLAFDPTLHTAQLLRVLVVISTLHQ